MKKERITNEELKKAIKDPRRYSLNKRLAEINKKRFKKSFKNYIKWSFVLAIYIISEALFSILRFENRFNRNAKNIKKILVFKLEHIGDLILSTPVYREIKKAYPGSGLYVVTTENIEDTLENNPYIDKHYKITPRFTHRFLHEMDYFQRLLLSIKNIMNLAYILFFVRPDVAISLRNDYKNIFLNYFSGARIRIGHAITPYNYLLTHKVNYNGNMHEIKRNLELLEQIGIKTNNKNLELFPNKKNLIYAEKLFEKNSIKKNDFVVSMHIGGSGSLKWWPAERFVEVAEYLVKKHKAKIIILAKGKDEEEKANVIKNKFSNGIATSFDSSVMDKAAIIKKSSILICNDSGPMHISAAVRTPMIAMFGPGNYKYYKPLDKIHTVIYKNLPCSPCAPFVQDEENDCPENVCMKLITMKEVIKEIDNKLNKFINLQSFNHSNEWKRSN